MNEFVWVLDNYIDRVAMRKRNLVEKDDRACSCFGMKIHSFESERDALVAMMLRARRARRKAAEDLKQAEKRYKRCVARCARVGNPR